MSTPGEFLLLFLHAPDPGPLLAWCTRAIPLQGSGGRTFQSVPLTSKATSWPLHPGRPLLQGPSSAPSHHLSYLIFKAPNVYPQGARMYLSPLTLIPISVTAGLSQSLPLPPLPVSCQFLMWVRLTPRFLLWGIRTVLLFPIPESSLATDSPPSNSR